MVRPRFPIIISATPYVSNILISVTIHILGTILWGNLLWKPIGYNQLFPPAVFPSHPSCIISLLTPSFHICIPLSFNIVPYYTLKYMCHILIGLPCPFRLWWINHLHNHHNSSSHMRLALYLSLFVIPLVAASLYTYPQLSQFVLFLTPTPSCFSPFPTTS